MPNFFIVYRAPGQETVDWKRKRVDAASKLFLDKVYEMIRANAKLDTAHGHRVMDRAKELAYDLEYNPEKFGTSRYVTVEMDGYSVSLWESVWRKS